MSRRVPSVAIDPSPLGKPLHFGFTGKKAPNRFLKAAMSERLSTWHPVNQYARGIPTKPLQKAYQRWGEGGAGHILTGNIMIAYDHLEGPGNLIIPPDTLFEGERFEAFQELASRAKTNGALVTGQVMHPGRQVSDKIQKNPISASDIQLEGRHLGSTFAKPRAATFEEIRDIINRYSHAAEFLYKAGYDGIQLHAAHGYLLAQFLAKTTNRRTDHYGGSLRNRARLILEIAEAIRGRLPASTGFMLGIKINSVEFQSGGFSSEEARELCLLLEQAQFDWVELSGGTYEKIAFHYERESTKRREAYFIEFAEMLTPLLERTKVYVTGGIRTVSGMVNALQAVDGIGMARPMCQEFRLPKDILNGQVTGSIDQQVDGSDFSLASRIAAVQIKQVGLGYEPIDMSEAENVNIFMKELKAWNQKVEEEGDKLTIYEALDLDGYNPKPYGTVVAQKTVGT